ncbi:MAG: biotin synthase BioB [Myxococcota bacterium]|nr:biotin synthase BioB [Myxococcota bacterium]
MNFKDLAARVLEGYQIDRNEGRAILASSREQLDELLDAAEMLRMAAHGRDVTLHVLQNAKSGACPEDCSFCSQSTHFETDVQQYRMQTVQELVAAAQQAHSMGATRYCMVTSTRKPTDREIKVVCDATRKIKESYPIEICASLGFLDQKSAEQLAEAGVDRFNHNIETSERHFSNLVTTHTWQDRVDTVKTAKAAGMEACCGGIVGMGEILDDRLDLAFSLRDLAVESIPVNFLDPREGTPLGDSERLTADDCLRVLAMMRFVNPGRDIRVAGGREKALGEKQALALKAANSLFTEGYLTTGGQGYQHDVDLIENAGYRVALVMPA